MGNIQRKLLLSSVALASTGFVAPIAMAQDATDMPPAVTDEDSRELDTVTVTVSTGTLLRGVSPVGANVLSIDPEAIAEIAPASSIDLLARVPQVTNTFNTLPTALGNVGVPFPRPNIRNLGNAGSDTTLTLLNGHRLVGSGALQSAPDVTTIAPEVLGRLEVVANGGSATYGSDAVGGVINFITRNEIDGIEASYRHGFGDKYKSSDASLSLGKVWESGDAYITLNHTNNDEVYGRDRDYVQQDHTSRGGDDFRVLNCSPGHITLGDINFFLPNRLPGENRCAETDFTTLYPEQENTRAFANLTQSFGESLVFDVTAYYSDREVTNQGGGLLLGTGLSGSGLITAANPFFQTIVGEPAHQVSFSYDEVFGTNTEEFTTNLSAWGITPKLSWKINNSWNLTSSLNYGKSDNEILEPKINPALQAAALASSNPLTALNPYNLSQTNPAVLAALRDYTTGGVSEQELFQIRSVLDGDAFELPAGTVKLAVGAEYTEESLDAAILEGTRSDPTRYEANPSREITSFFGEVLVPILSEDSGTGSLEVSLAARHDSYSDAGDTTNPQVGFNYKPIEDLTIRGSVGTSFNAPSLNDSVGGADLRYQIIPVSPVRAPDSLPTDLFRPTVVVAGSNPDIKPQEADTMTIGFDWAPSSGAFEGWRTSLTYYKVDFKNQIAVPPILEPAFFLTPAYDSLYDINPTLEQVLARAGDLRVEGLPNIATVFATSSPYVVLDARRINLGSVETDGLDFEVSYLHPTDMGAFYSSLGGTYALNRDVTPFEGASASDGLEFGVSRLKAVATFGWHADRFDTTVRINHNSGYDANPTASVDGFTTVNYYAGYDLPTPDYVDELKLTLNVDNLIDEDPPFFADGDGFANGSTLGRVIYLGLKAKF